MLVDRSPFTLRSTYTSDHCLMFQADKAGLRVVPLGLFARFCVHHVGSHVVAVPFNSLSFQVISRGSKQVNRGSKSVIIRALSSFLEACNAVR